MLFYALEIRTLVFSGLLVYTLVYANHSGRLRSPWVLQHLSIKSRLTVGFKENQSFVTLSDFWGVDRLSKLKGAGLQAKANLNKLSHLHKQKVLLHL